jgi:hypothetical protein
MTDSQLQKPASAQPEPGKDEGQPQAKSPQSDPSQATEISHPLEETEKRPKDSKPTKEKDQRQKHAHPSKTDWIMAWATVGILVATAVNVFVAYKQWLEIKSNSQQTKDALAASNALAEAAKQANILRQNADRAFMYAAPGRVFHVTPGSDLQAYITVGNSGLTIAENVERWAGVRIMTPPGTDAVQDLKPMMSREEGVLVVSPRVLHNLIRQLPNRKALTKQDVDDIRSGKKRIYVFGAIAYKDAFGKAHSTEFCFMYYGHEHAEFKTEYATTIIGYYESQGQYCNKHNETDHK